LPFLGPGIVFFAVFRLVPTGGAVYFSLFDWSGIGPMKFVGIGNWSQLFSDEVFWISLRDNVYLIIASVGFEITLGLMLAYAMVMEPKIRGKSLFKTAFFNPMMFTPAAVALLWKLIYFPVGGPLNSLLESFGLSGIDWLGDPNIAVWSIILVVVWQWTGWYFVLSMAGMSAIPMETIESAIVDGASKWQLLRDIVIPQMRASLFMQVTLGATGSMMYFDLFYIMNPSGGAGHSSEVLSTWLYKQTFMWSRVGYSAAMASLLALMTFAIGYYWIRQVTRAS
jgi:raffinose/stachyose/melibiose transport system permease protein